MIAVCDGIAMGHAGMRHSLASRELVADSVEVMASAHSLDGLVLVPNCDKIVPGMLMAAARLNVPAIFVSGGPMMAGRYRWWAIIGAHEETANAMAHPGDVLLVPVARADALPILHGIASAALSRTVGPAEAISLPTDPPDDPLPNIVVGIQAVRAGLRVAQSHASRPINQFL